MKMYTVQKDTAVFIFVSTCMSSENMYLHVDNQQKVPQLRSNLIN